MNRLFRQENYNILIFLIFDFKGELLAIKSRRETKENAIPTLFDHALLPKSIERLLNDCKTKQIDK